MFTSPIFNQASVAPYMGTTFAPPQGLLLADEIRDARITPDNALDRFYGEDRMAIARSFVDAARSGQATAEVVFATRRNGKTALTHYLKALAKRDMPDTMILRLDGGSAAGSRTPDELYRRLVTYEKGFEKVSKSPEGEAKSAFWQKLFQVSKKRPVIVTVDEPYSIIDADPNFFKEWRALYDRGANISVLFTTFTEAILAMMREHNGVYSSSMNVAKQGGIPTFTADDIGKMLMNRHFESGVDLRLSAGFSEFMRVMTGGNPYLLDTLRYSISDIFTGKAGVDWRALTDPEIKARDYLLLLPRMAWDMHRQAEPVRSPFNGAIRSDGSISRDSGDRDAVDGFSTKRYFNLLSRRLLLSGRMTFSQSGIFSPAEADYMGLQRGGSFYDFWNQYLLMTGIVKETLSARANPVYTLDQLPYLMFDPNLVVEKAEAVDLGIGHIFDRYPSHAGNLYASFRDGKIVVDLDDQPSDDVHIREVTDADTGYYSTKDFAVNIPPEAIAEFFFHHTAGTEG